MKTLVRITFALMIFLMAASVSYSQNDTTNRWNSEASDRNKDVDAEIDADRDKPGKDVDIEIDRNNKNKDIEADVNRDRDNDRDRNADSRIKSIGSDNDMTKNEDSDEHILLKDMHKMMEDMDDLELTGDFDLDFAKMMIEHHEGGIDMARTLNNKGENEELKKMAEATIDKNQGDIGILKDFIDEYKESGKKHDISILQNSMQKNMNEMHHMDLNGNMDQDFAKMMSAHHAHAIDMAKMELEHGMSPLMKDMAKKIIDTHQKEIGKLKDWSSRQK
jgi:uncharacterized protein (DUF305 family)